MKNWRNSEPFLNRDGGCRRCTNPSSLHKIKEAISKTADKFKSLWNRRKREYEHEHPEAEHNHNENK